MSPFDITAMAFMNLWRRKLRGALTVLGMAIGTASIVVMISIGIGINVGYMEQLQKAGSLTRIVVNSEQWVMDASGRSGSSQKQTLDDKAVKSFSDISGVDVVAPILRSYSIIKTGKYVASAQMIGIDPDAAEKFDIKPDNGRMYTKGNKLELVLGGSIIENFSDPKTYRSAFDYTTGTSKVDPLVQPTKMTFDYNQFYNQNTGFEDPNNPIKLGKVYDVKVVGMMDRPTDGGWSESDWSMYVDISQMKKLVKENKDFMYMPQDTVYTEVWVKAKSVNDVTDIQSKIKDLGFGSNSMMDAINMAKESSRQLQQILGALGGVSLFVAAIGIMNTMMMSIYERTKEIGVIKVLGCRMGNICALFLAEASFIGLFGGAVGLGLSYGISALLNNVFLRNMDMKSVIPLYLALGAVVFSSIVALISGFYPALRAMRLSPLAAIRSE